MSVTSALVASVILVIYSGRRKMIGNKKPSGDSWGLRVKGRAWLFPLVWQVEGNLEFRV